MALLAIFLTRASSTRLNAFYSNQYGSSKVTYEQPKDKHGLSTLLWVAQVHEH